MPKTNTWTRRGHKHDENDDLLAMLIGDRLKYQRELHGWTQLEVSVQAKVSMSNYGQWERGNRIPTVQSIIVLAQVFGCEFDDLITVYDYDPNGVF